MEISQLFLCPDIQNRRQMANIQWTGEATVYLESIWRTAKGGGPWWRHSGRQRIKSGLEQLSYFYSLGVYNQNFFFDDILL